MQLAQTNSNLEDLVVPMVQTSHLTVDPDQRPILIAKSFGRHAISNRLISGANRTARGKFKSNMQAKQSATRQVEGGKQHAMWSADRILSSTTMASDSDTTRMQDMYPLQSLLDQTPCVCSLDRTVYLIKTMAAESLSNSYLKYNYPRRRHRLCSWKDIWACHRSSYLAFIPKLLKH